MKLTSELAEHITGGKSNKPWQTVGVSIDTRTLKSHNLFIPLVGRNYNAHQFIKQAFLRGAGAAVISKDELQEEHLEYPLLIVDDTQQALIDIAKKARADFTGIVIGITGSVGKTTTKEMLKLVLSKITTVYANEGNLNNHIGMPLSLANLQNKYKVAVFELGMSNTGEIEYLSNILQPHIAVITTVTNTHSENFRSLEEIFLAKMEIITGLTGPKQLVFNTNNCFFNQVQQISRGKRVALFGFGEKIPPDEPPLRIPGSTIIPEFELVRSNIEVQSEPTLQAQQHITATLNHNIYQYILPSLAKHKGLLSVLVLGIVDLLGLNLQKAISAFSAYKEVGGRGEIITLNLPRKVVYLIDDSYNASPSSMQKSILMLQHIPSSHRKILVLADMLELDHSIKEHQKLKQYIIDVNASIVITLGNNMQHLVKILPKSLITISCNTTTEVYQILISYLQNDDVVLLKGSYGMGLYKVVTSLKNLNT